MLETGMTMMMVGGLFAALWLIFADPPSGYNMNTGSSTAPIWFGLGCMAVGLIVWALAWMGPAR